ncbi:MAG: hypothetical protein GY795_11690 [Desulfobacterales bacterium]|nr:hypothetical protein [Desulfobacterales bacterium]
MSHRKYLLDENISPRLKKALLRQSPDMLVRCVGDSGAPPLQTTDPDILIWCENKNFTLVTNNRASMPVHINDHLAVNRHIPGIFILNPIMTMQEIIDELTLIWELAEPDEYTDRIIYLPL